MAAQSWIGTAGKTTDQSTITIGGTWATGDTATVTLNGKSVVVTVGSTATLAGVSIDVFQAFNSSTLTDTTASYVPIAGGQTFPEFTELFATNPASGTVLLTARVAGVPMGTVSVSKSSTSGTISIVHTTTGTGPNDWGNTANWLSGSVPVSSDTVTIDVPVSILYGLAQSAVTLTSMTITARFAFGAQIGNPVINPAGYYEYRAVALAIGCTTLTSYSTSGMIKINFGSIQTAATIYSTGASTETGRSACQLQGTHASNVLNVLATASPSFNDVGWGSNGETATVLTGTQKAGTLTIGSAVTLTTLTQIGGSASVYCAATTITAWGTMNLFAGAITTLNVNGGTTNDASTGTVTTANVKNGAVYNTDQAVGAKTITTLNLTAGTLINTANRLTANGTTYPGRTVVTAS